MKSHKTEQPPAPATYPVLKIAASIMPSRSFAVLFIKHGTGVVVWRAEECGYRLGHHSEDWHEPGFERLNGEVILSND